MNRIENAFKNKPIFMPYFPLGYPDLDTSIDVIEALAKNGADLIEVGLSFSDPLADGPVIQQATQIALEKGITVKKSLEAVKELRKRGVDHSVDFDGLLQSHAGVWTGEIHPRCPRSRRGWIHHP
jgi:tryptophan synthase alpha subunit